MDDLSEAQLAELFKKFVENERQDVVRRVKEAQVTLKTDQQADEARRADILHEVELHKYAVVMVEEAVEKYRANLYHLARQLASEQLDSGVVTRAHVRQAQALMARGHRRYSWDDALLGIGGLMLGCALPHLIDLFDRGGQGNPVLVTAGIAGALLFGMGVLAKAKA